MLDFVAVAGLEWLYDRVEDRYGRAAAWLVTGSTALIFIGILVWILVRFFGRL
jgi:Na+/melibiose symporter-like transporter